MENLLPPIVPTPYPTPQPGFQSVAVPGITQPLRLPFNPLEIQVQNLGIRLPDVSLSIDFAMWLLNILWPYFIIPVGLMLGFYLLSWIVQTFRQAMGMLPTSSMPLTVGQRAVFRPGAFSETRLGGRLAAIRQAWRESRGDDE